MHEAMHYQGRAQNIDTDSNGYEVDGKPCVAVTLWVLHNRGFTEALNISGAEIACTDAATNCVEQIVVRAPAVWE